MAFLNPWSLSNKATAVYDFLISNDLDLFAVAESWLQANANEPQRMNQHESLPPNYQMIFIPRPDGRRGGGIAVIFKMSIIVKVLDFSKTKACQFEYLVCSINVNKFSLKLIIVYRPNPTSANKLSVKLFWKQFEKLISRHAVCTEELIITGDLNFHLETDSNNTLLLRSLLEEYGLDQKVHEPTHTAGHTLDILIIRSDSSILKYVHVLDPAFCNEQGKQLKDHFAIHWSLNILKPEPVKKETTYRDLKNIDYSHLRQELETSNLCRASYADILPIAEMVDLYNNTLKSLLDRAAPVKTKTVIIRPNTKWYTDEITLCKRVRRQAERKYIRTKSNADHELYREQCRRANWLLRKTKRQFFSSKIISANRDQKVIFQLTNSWMGTNKNVLPSCDCQQTLANEISKFFTEKARAIHKSLKETLVPTNPYIPVRSDLDAVPFQTLQAFDPATTEEVRELVMASASKHCELDPAPTNVVKNLIDVLAPSMASIVNKSLSSGIVPPSMKNALVRPSLKKSSLDPEDISNYRPVSNLSFLSKILEKVVNKRLDSHLENNGLLNDSQSAYRKHHSTETLLIKVQNDILQSLDSGYATILVMLDISAAFDVVDHQRLLSRHKEVFGIEGVALEWLSSYLQGRSQCVVIGNHRSELVNIEFGFPQGSVLGGKKFNMYSTPLGTLILQHDVQHKCYADDTQKYLSFCLKDEKALNSAIIQLQRSLGEVQLWMSANMLKMNTGKTELIIFAPRCHLQNLKDISLNVDSIAVQPTQEVDNLGVIFDSALSMEKQINAVSSTCYYHIRRISKIRKFLTVDATRSLVNAYVVSRLDYCNSLLAGLPDCLLKKLQRVQNCAARLVKKLPWRSRITRYLRELHWLPIVERIKFKILLLTYKALNNLSPRYLKDIFHYYCPPRALRSSSRKLLVVRRTRTKYGTRALSNFGPKLWNALPLNIRTANTLVLFKSLLKTHLFNSYFNNMA